MFAHFSGHSDVVVGLVEEGLIPDPEQVEGLLAVNFLLLAFFLRGTHESDSIFVARVAVRARFSCFTRRHLLSFFCWKQSLIR